MLCREELKMLLLIWLVPIRIIIGLGSVLIIATFSYVAAYQQ